MDIEQRVNNINNNNSKIRLHIPAIPHTITRDEYSHCAFTSKVQRFSPMMRSLGFEVYHYGVETSISGANSDIELFTKEEWTQLRIQSLIYLEPNLTLEQATAKNEDPTMILNHLSNWTTPLCVEFNKRLNVKLKQNYRSNQTDIICIPLSRSYEDGIKDIDAVKIETGIGYSGSYLNFRIFESYSWLSSTLGEEKKDPNNYWFVVPISYNIPDFHLSLNPTPLRIGFLGRIVSSKGCGIIIEIAKKFPHVTFILCGAGDPNPFLQFPNIVYKFPIHGNERSEYLGSCVALLHPTKYLEPFGSASVEAQLCGTPVIASDWGGMVETIEHFKTGLLCHTLADYCYGVQLALDGKFDRRYIRQRAVEKYDMYKMAHKYEYVFKSVLDIFNPEKNGWYSPDCHIELDVQVHSQHIYTFLVYYGTVPNYFQLYLDSLEINKDVLTVFMITDIDIYKIYKVPSNLIVIQMSLNETRKRISTFIEKYYNRVILSEDLVQTNYKLVDFKIIFPILFDDILQRYNIKENDYVGWIDCDVIYGKFSNFMNFDDNYEILGGYHGHFTAIKNTDSFKHLFLKIPNYFDLITDNSNTFITDEIAYREPLLQYLEENKFKMFYANAYFCDIVPPCFFHMFRKNHADLPKNFFDVYHANDNISYLFFDKINKQLFVKYDENNDMKEVLYCHLQKRKMELLFQEYDCENGFYINENSFYL